MQLSVILPVFNGGNYVVPAIQTVLSQSYGDFELLVVDDGSTDDACRAVAQISDARLRLVSRANRGLGFTLNELLHMARGEFVARMDADDLCYPDRLRKQVGYLWRERAVVMVGGQVDFVTGESRVAAMPVPVAHRDIVLGLRRGRFTLCHPAVMFRRCEALQIGGYRVAGAGEDLDFFLRMSEVGELANLKDTILSYRIQQSSLSMRKRNELQAGYAFAIFSAERRCMAAPELQFEEFIDGVWSQRSWWRRLTDACDGCSEVHYRRFIMRRAARKYVSAALSLLIAGALRPRVAARRAMDLWRSSCAGY
jgi:glycosyltransferase involved in cell wall biosynthesis